MNINIQVGTRVIVKMEQAWLDEGDVIITKNQFEFFQALIKFKNANEKLFEEWNYENN